MRLDERGLLSNLLPQASNVGEHSRAVLGHVGALLVPVVALPSISAVD
jgi:hypothetical protein